MTRLAPLGLHGERVHSRPALPATAAAMQPAKNRDGRYHRLMAQQW